MNNIKEMFIPHRARSQVLSRYKAGDVPYLANGFGNNGIAAFVTPLPRDKVFDFRAVVISAFGEVTLQMPPFIAYGAAGTSLIVLQPRKNMDNRQMAYVVAWLNNSLRGRFNWYHRATPDRILRITVPDDIPATLEFDVKSLIPKTSVLPIKSPTSFGDFSVDDLFTLHRAKSGLPSEYQSGSTAYIGNGFGQNGVVEYVNPRESDKVFNFEAVVVSAFCEATVHTPPFIACSRAGNGLVVLEPKSKMSSEQLLYVAAYINLAVRWRFNWYRQTTTDRIKRLRVLLPVAKGLPDDETIKRFVKSTPYWDFLRSSGQTY